MAKEAKTNAMRMLDRQKVPYESIAYECDEFIDGFTVQILQVFHMSSLLKHL